LSTSYTNEGITSFSKYVVNLTVTTYNIVTVHNERVVSHSDHPQVIARVVAPNVIHVSSDSKLAAFQSVNLDSSPMERHIVSLVGITVDKVNQRFSAIGR
jgi:hypothetical protein